MAKPCIRLHGHWVWLLVSGEHPSSNNLQIGKWVAGGSPCRSFRQKKLSDMVKRLFLSLAVPSEKVSTIQMRER